MARLLEHHRRTLVDTGEKNGKHEETRTPDLYRVNEQAGNKHPRRSTGALANF